MAGENYKQKHAKLEKIRKKNIQDVKSMYASIGPLKSALLDVDIRVESFAESAKNHRRYDHEYYEELEPILVKLMYLQEDLADAMKKKDRDAIKDAKNEIKVLAKKEAKHLKMYRSCYLWTEVEVQDAKNLIKWLKTMPKRGSPKGL